MRVAFNCFTGCIEAAIGSDKAAKSKRAGKYDENCMRYREIEIRSMDMVNGLLRREEKC